MIHRRSLLKLFGGGIATASTSTLPKVNEAEAIPAPYVSAASVLHQAPEGELSIFVNRSYPLWMVYATVESEYDNMIQLLADYFPLTIGATKAHSVTYISRMVTFTPGRHTINIRSIAPLKQRKLTAIEYRR